MIEVHVVPDIYNVLAQWGSTLVLFLVIRHFVYEPMKNFLEKRQADVVNSLTEADEKNREAEELRRKYEQELSSAKEQGQEIIESSRKRAESIEREREEEGRKQANALVEKARVQIEREKKEAAEEVRTETADLALLIAEKLLQEELDEGKQRDLVDGFIEQLEHNNVQ